jgi:hypothetical protein
MPGTPIYGTAEAVPFVQKRSFIQFFGSCPRQQFVQNVPSQLNAVSGSTVLLQEEGPPRGEALFLMLRKRYWLTGVAATVAAAESVVSFSAK